MALFKNAKQIIIPEDMADTKKWISDEEIINMFFDVKADVDTVAIDYLNIQLSDNSGNVPDRYYSTANKTNLFDSISIGEAA